MYSRRNTEAVERRRARRAREDQSARLRNEVPDLQQLQLAVTAFRGQAQIAEARHVRRFVVEQAPALFVLPCTDSSCQDGGHDVTTAILRALRAHLERFEGENACNGRVGTAECARVLHYVGTATYR